MNAESKSELQHIIKLTAQYLREQIAQGKHHLYLSRPLDHLMPDSDPLPGDIQRPNIAEVEKEALVCVKCRLWEKRTQVVFGEGSLQARLMFIGEGPGRDEDMQGRPFVGAAGQLLTKIVAAIQLTREEVYIANIVKCRPPDNRQPRGDEIQTCHPYLLAQIRYIQPAIICALGNVAAQTLLNTSLPMNRLRGKFHSYGSIKLLPTYHPAALLRNPNLKRAVWDDMQMVKEEYQRRPGTER